jgi:hypothetical protein
MPWVELEPTIPAFERAKKVHALDRMATVMDLIIGLNKGIISDLRSLQNDVLHMVREYCF